MDNSPKTASKSVTIITINGVYPLIALIHHPYHPTDLHMVYRCTTADPGFRTYHSELVEED